MKRLLYPVLLVFLPVFAFNCQKEVSYDTDLNPGGKTAAPVKATVQGRVIDENGQPASNVSIKAGGKTATTDSRGYFRIIKTSLDKNASVVIAEKTGYFKAYRTFQATEGANHVVIKLIKKTLAGSINSAAGGNVTLANGSKIALPAEAVVKAAGGTYTGSINIYAAYIDPTANDISQTIPGSLMADDKDGKRVTLSSYGMMAVELESSAGEKLQIATGKTATLTTPIPSSVLSSAPSTIALWYVDEQTGIWKEEGTATKTGNAYIGEVKHFSFWNCDVSASTVNLSMTLKNAQGVPLVNVAVRLSRSAGYWSSSYGYTDSMGKVSGLVPANEALLLEVLDDCVNAVFSQNIGPFTQNTNLGTVTVSAASSSILTIQGRLLNCSGAAVTDGYAIVNYGYSSMYVSTNSSGDFSLSILRCGSSPLTCDITGVDNIGQEQATVPGIVIVTPVTNSGNIVSCGTSAVQFFNYTLDGTNYSLSSLIPLDSIQGSSFPSGSATYTSLNGRNLISNKTISLYFNSVTIAPGTYNLSGIMSQNLMSGPLLTPSTITLTSFPASSGGFYEGNFTGNFKDTINPAPIHTISGSFRVRRN
ncbi:MAG: carboxypeptidase regulatory-like domain-containing protein [Chitinophagaceae bacterium]|nr:carboxypeptidase regulatory-like domain-containing protein [Chitinophagaceae bacterium]